MSKTRVVFVLDEQPIFRLGLSSALATHAGIVIAGAGHLVAEAVERAAAMPIDCVFLGARGHVLDTPVLDHVRALRSTIPQACVVLLLDAVDQAAHARARRAGAGGCLTRAASLHEVLQAALMPRQGLPDVSSPPHARERPTNGDADYGDVLTDREADLLQLMARGLSNKDIGTRLSIKVPTVKFHVGNIMSKLHAENRTAAVLTALRSRLVRVEAA